MVLRRLAEEAQATERELAGPVELLVCVDGTAEEVTDVRGFVLAALAGTAGVVSTRVLVVPGAEYYEMKNAGAAEATGDVVVYLDCDVVPEPGWLANLLPPFEDAGGAGGAANPHHR